MNSETPPSFGERLTYSYEIPGFEPKVSVGEFIQLGQTIAEPAPDAAGVVIDVAGQLRKPPKAIAASLRALQGQPITEGAVLAAAGGPFGFGKRSVQAPFTGHVAEVMEDVGTVVLRTDGRVGPLLAKFPAKVESLSESEIRVSVEGCLTFGAAGFGIDVGGAIRLVGRDASIADALRTDPGPNQVSPRIVAFQGPVDASVAQLVTSQWRPHEIALIVPSLSFDAFSTIRESYPHISLFSAYGFGAIGFGDADNDPLWDLLTRSEGLDGVVIVSGQTEKPVFAVLSLDHGSGVHGSIGVGSGVVVPTHSGLVSGTVVENIGAPTRLESGRVALVSRVALDDGGIELFAVDQMRAIRSSATA